MYPCWERSSRAHLSQCLVPINNLTHNEIKMPWASATVCIRAYAAACTQPRLPTNVYTCKRISADCHMPEHVRLHAGHMPASLWWTSGLCTLCPLGQISFNQTLAIALFSPWPDLSLVKVKEHTSLKGKVVHRAIKGDFKSNSFTLHT